VHKPVISNGVMNNVPRLKPRSPKEFWKISEKNSGEKALKRKRKKNNSKPYKMK